MIKSESIQNIAKALAEFQQEVKNPANTEFNPFYKNKYAPLHEILNGVRPILSKHGLSVLQSPSGDGSNIIVSSILMHASGEWIEPDPLVLRAEKATAQGAGSAITYARRYALSAILGIASEDDDDGNHAESHIDVEEPKKEKKKKPTEPVDRLLTVEEAANLGILANNDFEIVKRILKEHGHESCKTVKISEYEKICKAIEENTGLPF